METPLQVQCVAAKRTLKNLMGIMGHVILVGNVKRNGKQLFKTDLALSAFRDSDWAGTFNRGGPKMAIPSFTMVDV